MTARLPFTASIRPQPAEPATSPLNWTVAISVLLMIAITMIVLFGAMGTASALPTPDTVQFDSARTYAAVPM